MLRTVNESALTGEDPVGTRATVLTFSQVLSLWSGQVGLEQGEDRVSQCHGTFCALGLPQVDVTWLWSTRDLSSSWERKESLALGVFPVCEVDSWELGKTLS